MAIKVSIAALAAALPSAFAQVITVNCQPVAVYRGDPIVFPDVVSPHVHAVVGGTGFYITESGADARAANATTCDKYLDNSNYWQPQLYHQRHDGKFEMVTFQGTAAYYINRACDYAPGRQNCNDQPIAKAPPVDLRMVVGDPFLRTFDKTNPEQRAISHVCLGEGDEPETPYLPTKKCQRMRAETFFPSCWDGKNLDSSNHKSHMAFPAIGDYNTGVCPQSHPIAILSVFFEFFYDTGAINDFNQLVWAMGDPTGYGLHGDYLQGWTDQGRLERAMATCSGPKGVDDPNCSLNLGGPDGSGRAHQYKTMKPAPINEEVGFNGPLDKLPGNNPVTGQPVRG